MSQQEFILVANLCYYQHFCVFVMQKSLVNLATVQTFLLGLCNKSLKVHSFRNAHHNCKQKALAYLLKFLHVLFSLFYRLSLNSRFFSLMEPYVVLFVAYDMEWNYNFTLFQLSMKPFGCAVFLFLLCKNSSDLFQ